MAAQFLMWLAIAWRPSLDSRQGPTYTIHVLTMGQPVINRIVSPMVKLNEREAKHLSPPSIKIWNEYKCTFWSRRLNGRRLSTFVPAHYSDVEWKERGPNQVLVGVRRRLTRIWKIPELRNCHSNRLPSPRFIFTYYTSGNGCLLWYPCACSFSF